MKSRGSWALFVATAALSLGIGVTAHASEPESEEELRVLFIGNSYTRFNDLPRMVRLLAASIEGGPRVRAHRETRPGFDLHRHWRVPRVRRRIEHGGYHSVVLQAHSLSAFRRPERLEEYAERFDAHVREGGARLVLFQTWPRHRRSRFYRQSEMRGPEEMLHRLEETYGRLGARLGVPVAPVGRAFSSAARALPRTRFLRPDGTHPDVAGTYVAACVLYATLSGRDPRHATWAPRHLGPEEAARIRALAAEAAGR